MNGGNEDIIITQSNIIPNSFDSAKHNDIVDAKIGLREMKIQCPEKNNCWPSKYQFNKEQI